MSEPVTPKELKGRLLAIHFGDRREVVEVVSAQKTESGAYEITAQRPGEALPDLLYSLT